METVEIPSFSRWTGIIGCVQPLRKISRLFHRILFHKIIHSFPTVRAGENIHSAAEFLDHFLDLGFEGKVIVAALFNGFYRGENGGVIAREIFADLREG